MKFLFPPIAPIVVRWVVPERVFYQEWEFWLVLFTFVLAVVTGWLAFETRGLRHDSSKSIQVSQRSAEAALASATTARQQLQMMLQPLIEFRFSPGSDKEVFDGEHTKYFAVGTLLLFNIGQVALRITSLKALLERRLNDNPETLETLYLVELRDFTDYVMLPSTRFESTFEVPVAGKADGNAVFSLILECSDLGGVSVHSFSWHPYRGVRHTLLKRD